MSAEYDEAVKNASRLLIRAEVNLKNAYGGVPADKAIDLASKWTDLAAVTRAIGDAEKAVR